MADNKLSLGGKLGLPALGGFAAEIEGKYERTWGSRTEQVLQAAANAADLGPEGLGLALASDGAEKARDVFHQARIRAIQVADEAYIDALGRLVGRALDPAKIDEAAFLMSDLVQLEPIHLRVLLATFEFLADGQVVFDPRGATVAASREAQHQQAVPVTTLAGELGLSILAATRATTKLIAADLVASGTRSISDNPANGNGLEPTEWGATAVTLMFPAIAEVWLGDENYVPPRQA